MLSKVNNSSYFDLSLVIKWYYCIKVVGQME